MIEKYTASPEPWFRDEKTLYLAIFLAGIIFSLLQIHDSVINRDAIVYLSTAENFLENGISGNFMDYRWLPYSIMGATLAKVTGLSLELSFYTLNSFLYALIPIFFVQIYSVATGKKESLHLAALLILLLPSFNSYRDMIIRDVGFWCFSLLALLSFLRFVKTKSIVHSIIWQLSAGTAFLFRVEAITLLVGLPLCLLWLTTTPLRARIKNWFWATNLHAAIAAITLAYLLIQKSLLTTFLSDIPSTLYIAVDRINGAQEQMARHVLNEYSQTDALLIFIAGLLSHFIHVVLFTAGIFYMALFCIINAKKKTCIKYSIENKILLWALALNLLVLMAFLFINQFMIERYAVLSGLLMLLIASQSIIEWYKKASPYWGAWAKGGIVMAASIVLLDIFISKNPPPTNLKLAGAWLRENTSPNTPIVLTDNRILHYSGRLRKGVTCVVDKDLSISLALIDTLKPYSFIVIQSKREYLMESTKPLSQQKQFEKAKEFVRGNSAVVIYKNNNPDASLATDCNPFR